MVTVALQDEPRPALVMQADALGELPAVTVLPITSTLLDAPLVRVQLEPTQHNGLLRRSQVMLDKPQTPSTSRLDSVIGRSEMSPDRRGNLPEWSAALLIIQHRFCLADPGMAAAAAMLIAAQTAR